MKHIPTTAALSVTLLATTLLLGCANKAAQPESNTTTTTAQEPAAAPRPSKVDPKDAEKARKEEAKAAEKAKEAEQKRNTNEVIGINGKKGEVIGSPASNSKFKTVQIGMSMRQAVDLAGQPTDEGVYATGKAFIPFYYGGDRHRTEFAYKGSGRLIFAGDSPWSRGGGYSRGTLVKIVHDAKDSGYR
jgi:hypothetical protein